jgi:hypothetical protein
LGLVLAVTGGLVATSTTTATADLVIVDPPTWRVVEFHTSWKSRVGTDPATNATSLATAEWEYTATDGGVDQQDTVTGDGIIEGIAMSVAGQGTTEVDNADPNDPTSCMHQVHSGNPTAAGISLAYFRGEKLVLEFGAFPHTVEIVTEYCTGPPTSETRVESMRVNTGFYGENSVTIPLLDPKQEAVSGTIVLFQTFESDPTKGIDSIVSYGIVSSRCDLTGIEHADTDHDGITDCDEVLGGSSNPADSGFLELEKDFVDAPDSARVDLYVTSEDGTAGDVAAVDDAADGDSTGKLEVPTGTYDLTETAGANTDLADYRSALACTLRGTTTPVPVSESTVEIAKGDDVTCRFTNTHPTATGAKTIGFWQNKNGQKVISNGSASAGVCDSGTWLRQYPPFQDLAATATCSQVARYAHALVKAATARSASMNAMLKAQMLATALSVYFSDPQLGGNRLSASAPIGGRRIDLTAVCRLLGSSTGTATCSGVCRDASPAFDNASSLTVARMLEVASGHSNTAGSIWYSNVKRTQELAKDAFDAVNNQVAFAP